MRHCDIIESNACFSAIKVVCAACAVALLFKHTSYADNMTIIVPWKSRAEVMESANKELEIVSSWLTKHKLIVNPTKTKYMIFSTKPHKVQLTGRL